MYVEINPHYANRIMRKLRTFTNYDIYYTSSESWMLKWYWWYSIDHYVSTYFQSDYKHYRHMYNILIKKCEFLFDLLTITLTYLTKKNYIYIFENPTNIFRCVLYSLLKYVGGVIDESKLSKMIRNLTF